MEWRNCERRRWRHGRDLSSALKTVQNVALKSTSDLVTVLSTKGTRSKVTIYNKTFNFLPDILYKV